MSKPKTLWEMFGPKLKESLEKRDSVITIRVKASERLALEMLAVKNKCTLSNLIRAVLQDMLSQSKEDT